ncbi:MAG TPA: hypothetical protein DHV62_05850, partial [Elusimicrobia bacterium]|nr:hypothetical protein [Elusimicrobiota bacterium]
KKHTPQALLKMSKSWFSKGQTAREKNVNWRGEKPKCIECGKSLSNFNHKRCSQCRGNGYKGRNHWNWKGGISSLESIIRNLCEYKNWRLEVYKRDCFKCCNCTSKKNIHAHHIKPFLNILNGFLQTYNQFSPIDDKETLIRLAITYEPFWDVTNGKTLCEHCHKNIKQLSTEVSNGAF